MKQVHNKLVRDRIPDFLRAKGIFASAHTLPKEQLLQELLGKLEEEAIEAKTAERGKLAEELGDLLELLEAIASEAGILWEEVVKKQAAKRVERGGFQQGVFLEYTEETEDEHGREQQ